MKANGFQRRFLIMNEKNMNKQNNKQNGKQSAKANNKQNVRDCGGKCKPSHEENCK